MARWRCHAAGAVSRDSHVTRGHDSNTHTLGQYTELAAHHLIVLSANYLDLTGAALICIHHIAHILHT